MDTPLNIQIAMKLEEMAELLEQQGANPFRIRAYRRAAETATGLEQNLAALLADQGHKGLVALPNIGSGIATAISEIISTGRWAQLERLRGVLDPEHLFQTVPGIGPDLARKIHDTLHIDTLEALETAAYDGRLDQVEGIGVRRLAALRAALASMLGRTRRERHTTDDNGPEAALLLEVDRIYRERAEAGELPLIAPKRFNPDGAAWLPILHLEKDGWHFTAMFSNTARAHQLEKTREWVVIFFYDDHHQEGQHTVVTETHGPLIGLRVVRGKEKECRSVYQDKGESLRLEA
jgi:putative hydrolase